MKIGMSCDHRVVDGAIGANYLKALQHCWKIRRCFYPSVTFQDGGSVRCRTGGPVCFYVSPSEATTGAGAWLRSRFGAANLLGGDDFA